MIKQYIIKEHDTLRDIAKNQLGNPNRWVQIALEYNLDYPYIAQTGEEYINQKVLHPGDTLMLTFTSNDSEKVYYTEHKEMEIDYVELLMGIDLKLENGQLSLVGSSGGTDFLLAKGTTNIKQAIEHKLKVKKGNLTYYPTYGTLIHTYIGKISDLPAIEMIKAEFVRTVLEDGRIESVSKVKAEFDGYDNVYISSGLQLIGNFTSAIQLRVNPTSLQIT